jgi:MFS family permease
MEFPYSPELEMVEYGESAHNDQISVSKSGSETNSGGVAGEDKITTEAFLTLFGGFLLNFATGASIAFGSLVVYIVSYYRIVLEYTVDEDTFQPLFPLLMISNTLAFALAGKMVDMFDGQSKPVAAIFATFGITLCFLSILIQMNPYLFIVCFAVGFGSLKGSMIITSLRAGWSHLPKRKGLASGVILSGSGFGGGLAGMYILKITNPDDVEPVMDKHDGNLYYPKDLVKFYP